MWKMVRRWKSSCRGKVKGNSVGTVEGRVALVTGGARGIGRAIAADLAREGADVAVTDVDRAGAEEAAGEIAGAGRRTWALAGDVSSLDAAREMVEKVRSDAGRLDILVNNAGITRDALLLRMKEEDWDAVIAVNLKGAFNFCRAAVPGMVKQRWGRIVNMSSVVGAMGNAGQANYSASKAGVLGLTKTTARELAARNITANAVAPGFIDTDMTAVLPEAVKEKAKAAIPLRRMGRPEDVAEAVAFFASDEAELLGLTKSLAREVAARGVTVNAVAPGFIDTAMTQALPEKIRTALLGQIPAGRLGQVEDVVKAVLFLASPGAGYITGQVLHVNGGMYT